jgi:hypothetical protein
VDNRVSTASKPWRVSSVDWRDHLQSARVAARNAVETSPFVVRCEGEASSPSPVVLLGAAAVVGGIAYYYHLKVGCSVAGVNARVSL